MRIPRRSKFCNGKLFRVAGKGYRDGADQTKGPEYVCDTMPACLDRQNGVLLCQYLSVAFIWFLCSERKFGAFYVCMFEWRRYEIFTFGLVSKFVMVNIRVE